MCQVHIKTSSILSTPDFHSFYFYSGLSISDSVLEVSHFVEFEIFQFSVGACKQERTTQQSPDWEAGCLPGVSWNYFRETSVIFQIVTLQLEKMTGKSPFYERENVRISHQLSVNIVLQNWVIIIVISNISNFPLLNSNIGIRHYLF